jgi:hypothetical protein
VSVLKQMLPLGVVVVGILLIAGWSNVSFGRSSVAAAAQASPVPMVSVTTLPAMPGESSSAQPQSVQSAAPVGAPATNSWTLPIAPPLGDSYIQVVGEVNTPLTLTLNDLEKMKPDSLTLRFHTYTGVLLTDVLNRAGLRFSTDSQTLMRKYVFFQGTNGESAIVSFPEFTKGFNGQLILLAYLVDLRPVKGPGFVTLVVQGDRTTARYINVARIIVGEPLQ